LPFNDKSKQINLQTTICCSNKLIDGTFFPSFCQEENNRISRYFPQLILLSPRITKDKEITQIHRFNQWIGAQGE